MVPGGVLPHSLFESPDYSSDVRMDGGKAWSWPSSDDIEVWMRSPSEVGGKSKAEVLRKDLARVKKQNKRLRAGWHVLSKLGLGRR